MPPNCSCPSTGTVRLDLPNISNIVSSPRNPYRVVNGLLNGAQEHERYVVSLLETIANNMNNGNNRMNTMHNNMNTMSNTRKPRTHHSHHEDQSRQPTHRH